MNFSAACRGKRSTAARSSPSSTRRPRSARARPRRPLREGGREPETAPAAPAASSRRRSAPPAPTKTSSPSTQVRREPVERRVRDLQPGEVRRPLAQLEQHRDRHGVAARALELVDVERERRARAPPRPRSGRAARARRAGSTAGRSRRPRRRRPRRRARRARPCRRSSGRRSARDQQAALRRGEEELECPPALLDAEEQPLPRRPEREQAVEAARGEEVDVRAERVLVEPRRRASGVTAAARAPRSMPRLYWARLASRRQLSTPRRAGRTAVVRALRAPRSPSTCPARRRGYARWSAPGPPRWMSRPRPPVIRSLPIPPSTTSAPSPPSTSSRPASSRSMSIPPAPRSRRRRPHRAAVVAAEALDVVVPAVDRR